MKFIYTIMTTRGPDGVLFETQAGLKARWDEYLKTIISQFRNEDGTYHHKFEILENKTDAETASCRFRFKYLSKSGLDDTDTETETLFDTWVYEDLWTTCWQCYETKEEYLKAQEGQDVYKAI